MSEGNNIEKELVEKFIKLDGEAKRLVALSKEIQKECDEVESKLLDLLNAEGAEKSAKYSGIGHVTCRKPRVTLAIVNDEKMIFDFLRRPDIDRGDLIKTGVHPVSLAAFVDQRLKAGFEAPPGIDYIIKQSLTAYPDKG